MGKKKEDKSVDGDHLLIGKTVVAVDDSMCRDRDQFDPELPDDYEGFNYRLILTMSDGSVVSLQSSEDCSRSYIDIEEDSTSKNSLANLRLAAARKKAEYAVQIAQDSLDQRDKKAVEEMVERSVKQLLKLSDKELFASIPGLKMETPK